MNWTALNPHTCKLGESPFWHPQEQSLYWVDIDGHSVLRANGYTGEIEQWAMPAAPGCIAPAAGGGFVLALRNGIFRAPKWQGALTLVQSVDYDPATSRYNDGKCDTLGRFWAGTIYEPRDKALATLYSLDSHATGIPASFEVKASGATVANGLAWSPDNRTLYWTDTPSHAIRAWDWDAASNTLSNSRVFHQFAMKPVDWTYGIGGYGGRPDGAAVDIEGNYWAAMFEGGRVVKLSPAGELLAEFPTPALCPTMPCFGGDDLKTLYVTSASHNRNAIELADYPQSGCVFSTRVSVPGLPVNFFRD